MSDDGLITASELAKILKVNRGMIYKRLYQGRVTGAVKVGGNGAYEHWRFRPDSRFIPSPRRRPARPELYVQN